MDEELHWYSLTFQRSESTAIGTSTSTGSIYMGWPSKKVTIPRIKAAKEHANMHPDAVMLSCCYLGLATRDEMVGDQEEPEVTGM